MTDYNVCGVLVHARPGHADAVREQLLTLAGVDVHAVTEDHRLVVTVEDHADHYAADTLGLITRTPDVLSAAMIYQHSEALEQSQQEQPQ
jgi:nitrate reductase NapD